LNYLRMRSRGVLIAAAVIMVLAVFVAACGNDENKGGTTSGGTPVAGGQYNFPVRSEPLSIEPLNIQEVEANEVVHQCFQGLYAIETVDGVGKAVPSLAEKTEMNADGTVFTFTIKQGVTFAPPVNREVTAQDFVDSWNYNCDPANKSDTTYIFGPIKGIDPNTGYAGKDGLAVKATGKYTLEVTLSHPYPAFPVTLSNSTTFVYPVDYVNKIGRKAFFEKPVGTGPYMVSEWVHRQKITLVKNPNYWDKTNAGYVETINMPIIEDENAEWLEFQKGSIDFTAVPTGQVKAAQNMQQVQSGEWTAQSYPSVSVYYVMITANDKGVIAGPDNLPIRQALAMTADRTAVCNTVLEGVPLASDSIIPVTLPGFKAGLNPNPYDTAKGKSTLDAFTSGGGKVPAEIPYWYNTGAGHDKIAEALGAGWESSLGIKIALNGIETNSYWTQLSENKAPGMFRMGWGADYPDMSNFVYLFTTEGGQYGSYSFYSNKQVDDLYQQAQEQTDINKGYEMYNQAEALVLADVPTIPLYTYRDFRVTNNRIGGFNFSPYELVDMWKVWVKQ
jgi:oligopeptide transport system substrate-binding protein